MGKHEWFRWLIISIPSVIAGGVAGQFMAAWSAGALGVSIGVAASFALSKWEQRRGSSREDMAQIRGLSDREATDFIAIVEEALK